MSWDNTDPVTILCDRYWPDAYGGLERKMWNLSRALASFGNPVRVVTENRVGAPPFETILPNLVVQRVKPICYGPLWRCVSLVRVGWWYRRIRSLPPTGTLWVSDPKMAVAAMLAGRGRDLVYQPIGCHTAMNRLSRVYRRVHTMQTTAVMRWLDRLAYRLAPRIIFESHNVLDQFRRCYGRRSGLCVVHNGVEAAPVDRPSQSQARRRLGLQDDHWVVGFVGRLDPCKDVGFLFRAVAARADSRVRLLLVGEGPDRFRLEQLAVQHGLADHVVWAGRVDDPARVYAAMDVMVLPSLYEAFGNVILEAMAAGVPVVGRRRDPDPNRPVFTASEELIQDGQTGLLVDPHDPADLGRQLSMLRLFPGARRAMGRRCRAWAAARPWRVVVGLYHDAVTTRSEPQQAKAA